MSDKPIFYRPRKDKGTFLWRSKFYRSVSAEELFLDGCDGCKISVSSQETGHNFLNSHRNLLQKIYHINHVAMCMVTCGLRGLQKNNEK